MYEQTFLKMKLHETISVRHDLSVTRVPGGWLYEIIHGEVNVHNIVFVPFNKEFEFSDKGEYTC